MNRRLNIIALLAILFALSCKKSEEGPSVQYDAFVDKWYLIKETYTTYTKGNRVDEKIVDQFYADESYEFFSNNRLNVYAGYEGLDGYNGSYTFDRQNNTLTILRDGDMESNKLVFEIRKLTKSNLVLHRFVEHEINNQTVRYETLIELKKRLTDADYPKIKLTLNILDASSRSKDNPTPVPAIGTDVEVFLSKADLIANKPAFTGTTNNQGIVEATVFTKNIYLVKAHKANAANTIAGYTIAGVFQNEEELQNYPDQPFPREIGGLILSDINGDGIVNEIDKVGYTPVARALGMETVTQTILISDK